MAREGVCIECHKEKLLVRGTCLDCWPERRRQNVAYEQGTQAAHDDTMNNPYDQETDYNVFYSWEFGYSDERERMERQRLQEKH
ncbi:hypothetical protein [Fimbriiglobus ruber]|uniref:Uncharacterized protein n=1 Tax=Fimbriiglobus ruber TaxID=1908690 RepID=A0A225CY05_9BACT|nr:hypothetical protein [Fimbriiglobus ruber]OWK34250.1 hypothetical protein FRUB_10221 [Fimbriiglobus ruber]